MTTSRADRPSETQIRRMVHLFYERVRADPLLGPLFEDRIGSRWDAHMDRMVDFWSTVLLASGRYLGNPILAHRAIPDLEPRHFDRWLELFWSVAREVYPEPVARDVFSRAERMRIVLERNMDRAS